MYVAAPCKLANEPLNDPLIFALAAVSEPVIDTDPVNWCVFDSKLPKRVEPVINSVDEVIV
jgi:hypothetical protein